ncbi:hypothetical protein [Marinobacter nauticus]|uniref:Virion structural protein n=1 Tax=Marinobacter nauticus TaxID=2743 RepID=A0A833NDZ0_MARNT|nr:hypothetical protein [Marinobacter nauticus]KAE8546144.1 hypothetical protein F6453_1390 [Marinobacter nauticus]
MAWETGTATDHVDLFNKIRNFLTTNTDLVNAGENWEQMLGPTGTLVHGDQITLRGPGLTGTDNIYFGMETLESSSSDAYNIQFWGHASFSDTLAPRDQALKSPDQWVLLWNQPMTYWIIANGRRWMLVVKVSTVYSSAYCGFMLPYAAPSEYPYPMVVAGISYTGGGTRWSTEDGRSRFFASPGYNTMFTYWPDNVWRLVANYYDSSSSDNPRPGYRGAGFVHPTMHFNNYFAIGNNRNDIELESPDALEVTYNADKCFDGSYFLRDLTIISSAWEGPYDSVLGVLDGAYWIPGRANSSENIVNKDGVDHLVVQNLFRNGFRDYMALRLT